ncbi:hypothetical protein SteCoe_33851 [Stentor coeruleus]|uniref:DOMON domain-containing protein n=1 Tax=Stentor coeruleus TaxID=5963 RepID=A0A1R2AW69_9CILI|nr:hypothetical protein SteCoe_33851 [Stentor coeruleus]
MELFLIFSLVSSAMSVGVVYLPKDMLLSWKFPTPGSVAFELRVPQVLYDEYGYVGLGFKYTDDISGMYYADLINIKFNQPLEDCYGTKNTVPRPDVSLGGTSDLINPRTDVTADGLKITWERALKVEDCANDMEFEVGADYRLLWAAGFMDEVTGEQLRHSTKDRGTINIKLSEDFYNAQYKPFIVSSFN